MHPRLERVSRWVWLANGVIVLLVLVVTGVAMLTGWLTDGRATASADQAAVPQEGVPPSAAVRYDAPLPVVGSATRLVLLRETRGLPTGPLPSPAYGRGAGAVVNVALLAPDGTARLLFDRPVRVAWLSFPGAPEWAVGPMAADSAQRFAAYAVIEEDTDRDGELGITDDVRLFVSTLDGGGLRGVLPAGHRLEGARALADGRWLVATLGPGTPRPQRAFILDPGRLTLTPFAALDSAAAQAAAIARRR